jgi:hypothetical protein
MNECTTLSYFRIKEVYVNRITGAEELFTWPVGFLIFPTGVTWIVGWIVNKIQIPAG